MIEHEAYKETYHECMDKITAVKQDLNKLSDLAGGKEEVKKKLNKLKVTFLKLNKTHNFLFTVLTLTL